MGDIREKILAAVREGYAQVIVPAANATDLDDLPADERALVRIVLVEHVDEALLLAIPGLSLNAALRA